MKQFASVVVLLLLAGSAPAQTVADVLTAVKALDAKVTVKLANLEARVKALEDAGNPSAAPRMAVNHVHHYYPAGVVAPKVVLPRPMAPAVPPKVLPKVLPKVSRLPRPPAPGRPLHATATVRRDIAPPSREAHIRQMVRQEWARAAPVAVRAVPMGRCPGGN